MGNEIDALKKIDSELSGLNPDEQKRVLDFIAAKFGISIKKPATAPPISNNSSETKTEIKETGNSSDKTRNKGKGKKTKYMPKQIKNLDLGSSNSLSAQDFAAQKQPTNLKEKCVVAIYYLREHIQIPEISIDHVYTFFKFVSWVSPSDFPNTLQQAGSEGWLDTSSSTNILITPIGENLIEHTLPKSGKK